jgi:hypothetical protein
MAKTASAAALEQNAFLCAVGHICLQWALLEQTILFIIGAIENLPIQKAYKMFASLDIQPRLNMAIQLAEDAQLPYGRFIKPLKDIRAELQKGGAKIADRRNLFVHGVHKFGTQHGEYVLTMTRWKGDRQSQTVTLVDAAQLAHEIALQAQKADRVFCDYGAWKFGVQHQEGPRDKIAKTKAELRLIRREQFKRGISLVLASLKPV